MKSPVSPKVILSTVAAIVAPAVLASLSYLQTDEGRTLFASLPPVLVVFIAALITGLSAFVAGYVKRDPLRDQPPTEPVEGPADPDGLNSI